MNAGFQSSSSIFTVEYDAPLDCKPAPDVRSLLLPLVQYAKSRQLSGGLGTTNITGGSNYTTWTDAPKSTSTATLQASRAGLWGSHGLRHLLPTLSLRHALYSMGDEFAPLSGMRQDGNDSGTQKLRKT